MSMPMAVMASAELELIVAEGRRGVEGEGGVSSAAKGAEKQKGAVDWAAKNVTAAKIPKHD